MRRLHGGWHHSLPGRHSRCSHANVGWARTRKLPAAARCGCLSDAETPAEVCRILISPAAKKPVPKPKPAPQRKPVPKPAPKPKPHPTPKKPAGLSPSVRMGAGGCLMIESCSFAPRPQGFGRGPRRQHYMCRLRPSCCSPHHFDPAGKLRPTAEGQRHHAVPRSRSVCTDVASGCHLQPVSYLYRCGLRGLRVCLIPVGAAAIADLYRPMFLSAHAVLQKLTVVLLRSRSNCRRSGTLASPPARCPAAPTATAAACAASPSATRASPAATATTTCPRYSFGIQGLASGSETVLSALCGIPVSYKGFPGRNGYYYLPKVN
jgi:hypothetical protein